MLRFSRKAALGIVLLVILFLTMQASAATINVPADQPTIQDAIDAALPGDMILVHSGTYQEDLTVDKNLTLEGSDDRYQVVIEGSLTITADGVLINNFRITNPTGKHAITATDHSNLTIINNTIHDVGTLDDSTSGSNWGIAIISNAQPVDSVVIAGNSITNVAGGEGKSAHGIVVGWSTGDHDVTGLVIEENEITNVLSMHDDGVSGGRGAYGVLINHASPAHAGKTVDALIRNNTITSVQGHWARGIGLEGDTPGALVEGNVIDDVRESIDHDSVAIAVFLEDNSDAGTVTVWSNSFTRVSWGVGAHPATSLGTVNASGNHFDGDIVILNISKVFGDVDYTPWLESGYDVSEDPGFQGDFSTLWVAAASPQTGSLHRIEEAIDLLTGTRINLMPGVYEEQVWITVDELELVGSGPGDDPDVDSIIRAPAGQLPQSFSSPSVNRPVVGVIACGGVQIRNLRVDGDGQGHDNVRFHGIAFWNADGALEDCSVVGVRNTPLSGAHNHGVGVWAHNDTRGSYEIALTRVWVEDFQKNGFSLSGEGLGVTLLDVTAIGAGPTGVVGQNGIQISYGAGGSIDGCTIRDIDYTGATWTATGLLVLEAEPVHVQGAIIENCQTGAIWEEASGSFEGGEITGIVYDGLRATSFTAKAGSGQRRAAPQPMLEERPAGRARTPMTMHVEDSRFHGVAGQDIWGVYGWTDNTLSFAIIDCEVKDCSFGIAFIDDGGAVYDALVENSAIFGNADYGLYSNAAQAVQATCNWWGHIGGPDAAGNSNPAGDAIAGDAYYWPWLAAYPGPGVPCNQFPGENVSVQDADECVTPGNPCAELAVAFNRHDDTPVGGISVTFELSEELVLCDTPENSIAAYTGEGSWLGAFGNFTFQGYANGGSTYTADLAILGQPCGPTGSGILFTVSVARAEHITSDAVGTVTITEVLVRGCANEPMPGIPGAPGHINIDLTMPDPLQGLAAVQQKTGNPAGDTTNIQLSWTAPDPLDDAEWIHVWRKGWGSYPEYVLGGPAPTPPVTEANGWQHAGKVAATASGFVDLTDVRDFWYYAAFVEDACGNMSAVSELTEGTLNYHLGDVSDGVTPGAGDNVVGTLDISLLGTHYGAVLPSGDPRYYLDVGPTTDNSVDARPTTDGRVNFEDLMMFAINYSQVSKSDLAPPRPAAFNEIVLVPEAPGTVGEVFDVSVRMSGDGRIQGLSVPLTWDHSVVEPVGVRTGALLALQGGLGMVLSPEPGTLDAALFGVRDHGIRGEGVLAVVSFRVTSTGYPGIGLGAIRARGSQNQEIYLHGIVSGDVPGSLPQISALSGAIPNPFNPATELSFAIARGGEVRLSVYSLRGHLVSTLVHGPMEAGRYTVTWNGTDATGQTVASGSYIVRLEAPDRAQSRRITLVK